MSVCAPGATLLEDVRVVVDCWWSSAGSRMKEIAARAVRAWRIATIEQDRVLKSANTGRTSPSSTAIESNHRHEEQLEWANR